MNRKFPRRDGAAYYWQAAFVDAHDTHHVLPQQVWECLASYDRVDRPRSRKEYASADAAVADMLLAYGQVGAE